MSFPLQNVRRDLTLSTPNLELSLRRCFVNTSNARRRAGTREIPCIYVEREEQEPFCLLSWFLTGIFVYILCLSFLVDLTTTSQSVLSSGPSFHGSPVRPSPGSHFRVSKPYVHPKSGRSNTLVSSFHGHSTGRSPVVWKDISQGPQASGKDISRSLSHKTRTSRCDGDSVDEWRR